MLESVGSLGQMDERVGRWRGRKQRDGVGRVAGMEAEHALTRVKVNVSSK